MSTTAYEPATGAITPVQETSSRAEFTVNGTIDKIANPRNLLSLTYWTALALTYGEIYLAQVLYTIGIAIVLAGYFLI